MNKVNYSLCLFLLLIYTLAACDKKVKENNDKDLVNIVVDFDNQSSLHTSTIIDTFEYILLEKSEESLIGFMSKIELSNDDIFVLDGDRKLLHFSLEGRFLNKIGSIGRGPGEFNRIRDFSIYDDKIWVFDGWKIMVYEKKGKFLGVLYLENGELNEVSARNIEVTKDGIYLYNGFEPVWNKNKNSLVYLADHRALKIKHKYNILYNDRIHYANMMTSGNCLTKSQEGVLFFKFFNDTVYFLNGDGIIKKYAYDFGEKSLTKNERERLNIENTSMLEIQNRVQGIYKSFSLHKSILTCFFYNNKHLWHYKNFKTCEDILSSQIVDDLGCGANFMHFFESEGKLISYIPAEILHSENTKINNGSELYKIKLQTTKNDNPIIVVCTLK